MFHDIIQSVMDAEEACKKIQKFAEGYTLETYEQNELTRSAIERKFGILGEALNRVDAADPTFRDYLPEMGKVIGMRNRINHGYDRVLNPLLWDAVKNNVPDLQNKLSAWLDKNG